MVVQRVTKRSREKTGAGSLAIVVTGRGSVRRSENANISMTRFQGEDAAIIVSGKSKRERERETSWNINEKSPEIPDRLRLGEFRGENCIAVTGTRQRILPCEEFPHSRAEDTSAWHDYRGCFRTYDESPSRVRTFCFKMRDISTALRDSPIQRQRFLKMVGRDDRRRAACQIERKLT